MSEKDVASRPIMIINKNTGASLKQKLIGTVKMRQVCKGMKK